ncbi:MAG: ComEA family DNA-binding protein [Firmicutes bacterium]|jgi:competence protein ComEA|nr:ComEA family DNA-binding protein [Bacillota bacterium]
MWDFTGRQKLTACILLLAVAVGGIVLLARRAMSPPVVVYPGPVSANMSGAESVGQSTTGDGNRGSEDERSPKLEEEPEDLVVHVCGAVKNPGVYTLPQNARVADAVRLAGGLDDSAMEEAVNMAMRLTDSMQIYIPGISSSPVFTADGMHIAAGASDPGKVNINTATASQLQELPGIGQTLAERILEFRTANGRFERPEDLMRVSGIGEKKYRDLKDSITVH